MPNSAAAELEMHKQVFQWILWVLAKEDLVEGKTVVVDATTLEATAGLRSIVRRDTVRATMSI